MNNCDLGFESNNKLFLSDNLTPFNQQLAWMCKEFMKQAGKIQKRSSKGIVKLTRSVNEQSMSVLNTIEVRHVYPDHHVNNFF